MSSRHTPNTVAIFDKLAHRYQEKYADVRRYEHGLNLFCDALPPSASVLELACGPGNVTRYLLDRRADLRIDATDLAPNMIAIGKTVAPEARFEIIDCRLAVKTGRVFDAIMAAFCLPYLDQTEVKALFADVARTLPKGGIFYVSTMEDDYSQSGFEAGSSGDLVYMHYHTGIFLTDALAGCGLSVVFEQRLPFETPKPGTDLILIARKN